MRTHAGFYNACIACPASLICLTQRILNIYEDGIIHYMLVPGKKVFHSMSVGERLEHCPIAFVNEREMT